MKYIHVVKWIHVGLPAWAYSAAFEDQDEAEKYVKRLKMILPDGELLDLVRGQFFLKKNN